MGVVKVRANGRGPVTFGERVRQLRLAAGLTQYDLAEATDRTHFYICKIENGHCDPPRSEVIVALAGALGADAEELLLLGGRIPDSIRDRVLAQPEAFRLLSRLPDDALGRIAERLRGREADHA